MVVGGGCVELKKLHPYVIELEKERRKRDVVVPDPGLDVHPTAVDLLPAVRLEGMAVDVDSVDDNK
jgi:hypothetical protein